MGLVTEQQTTVDVIWHLGDGAERLLRERFALLLESGLAPDEEK